MDIRHCIVRVGVGSGVLVQGKNDVRYILTCTHVLGDDWQKIPIAFCDEKGLFSIETLTKVVTEPAPVSTEDIALLECQPELPAYYQPVKLLYSQHGWELPAYTYGFPDAFAKNGRDDRCRISKNSIHNDQGFEMLRLSESHAMKGGFSGSPLLDARYHHCLGIVSAIERPDIDHQGTLIYAVPSEDIAAYFTNYLEVQPISPYLARLRSMYQEVVLNDPKGMTLADIYVEPFYGVHRYCFKEKDERITKHSNKPFFGFDTSLHNDLLRLLNQENCLDLDAKKPGLILLLGYPGQGKTSFCKRLIYDLTGASFLAFDNIYFVRLRNVANPADLANNALKVIQTEIEDEGDAPPINWNNSLLILDGLDELNIKEGFQGGKIDDICKSLEQACEKYLGLRIVLSSRYGYVDLDAFKKRNITILRLEEFSKDQQKNWLRKYRAERFHPESPLNDDKLEEYHKHDSIKELLGQAILLHMIASLDEDASNKPNRAAIYNSVFNQLIERAWDKGQIGILNDIGLDQKTLRYALQDLAHAIFMSRKGYLRRTDLEKLHKVQVIKTKLKINNRSEDLLWRTVMVAFYLSDKIKDRNDLDGSDHSTHGLEFLHKSLYEYLCAEKIWRDVKNAFLSTTPDKEWVLNEGYEALKLTYIIFSARVMNQEVHDYLIEIVNNQINSREREILINRIGSFLPYCLERHFLYNFNSNIEKFPFEKAIATFRGYWTVLSSLAEGVKFWMDMSSGHRFASLCSNFYFNHSFLSNFKLINQNLDFSDFTGVNLSSSDLSMSNFSFAILNCTNLKNSNLYKVDLTGAILTGSDLRGANLAEASIGNAHLNKANLANANLSEAFLGSTDLTNVALNAACLARADLTHANLSFSNLSGTNLSDADLSDADLRGTDLREADLAGADLTGADLTGADLTGADLTGADLSKALLISTNMSYALVNYEQLSKAQSLYLVSGLSDENQNQLMKSRHFLFEKPEFE